MKLAQIASSHAECNNLFKKRYFQLFCFNKEAIFYILKCINNIRYVNICPEILCLPLMLFVTYPVSFCLLHIIKCRNLRYIPYTNSNNMFIDDTKPISSFFRYEKHFYSVLSCSISVWATKSHVKTKALVIFSLYK